MSNAGGHRDKGYAKWWIVLAVVFVIAIALVYVGPFMSTQPGVLNSPPTSITEAEQPVDNNTASQTDTQAEPAPKNVSIAEDSPSRGAEEAAPEPQQ
ncbi:MAG TPA: hypothetical protein VJ742_07945 [Nitrososphaera sp.]|nr:hypothetical protein [Nitrososphaera sp.]